MAALLLDSDTTRPPVGAALEIVTVPVEDAPPTTDVGENDIPTNVGAVTVRVAVFVVEPCVPVIVAATLAATAVVATLKAAVVWPAAIVTDAGTVIPFVVLLLERATAIPPVGAGPVRDTVPAELEPPVTDVGLNVTLRRVGTATARVAVFVVEPRDAVMVAVILAVTTVVDVVNVADVLPDATVTEAGTVTPLDVSLLERVTKVPPVAEGPDRVTVPNELAPPITDVGLRAALSSVGAVTVSAAVFVVEPRTAEIVAETLEVTPVVAVVNVAVVLPEATVTDAGTVTPLDVLLLERLTTVPPLGAALDNVTVPVELVPPITDVGLRITPVNVGAVTATVAVFVVLPRIALIVAVILAATGLVAVINVPVVFPDATVTEAGTVIPFAVLLLDRLTTVPPVGAAADNVTVPAELAPPATEVGLSERAVKLTAAKTGELQAVKKTTDVQTRK